MHVTSLANYYRFYGANKKTIIIVGIVLEAEVRQKLTALGKRKTFVVGKFDLGGGDMKVVTINIKSIKLHTPEPLRPATDGDYRERAASDTTTTNEDTTFIAPVTVQVFKAPSPGTLNNEAFLVVVAQPMAETPVWPLSPLTGVGGLVVGAVLSHVIDEPIVFMPSPLPFNRLLPLPRFLLVPIPPPPLPPIPAPHIPSPHHRYPRLRPTTSLYSTG